MKRKIEIATESLKSILNLKHQADPELNSDLAATSIWNISVYRNEKF